jgi:hypothetical protein
MHSLSPSCGFTRKGELSHRGSNRQYLAAQCGHRPRQKKSDERSSLDKEFPYKIIIQTKIEIEKPKLIFRKTLVFSRPLSKRYSSYTMAKGARASTRKANNVALKSRVFGPVEDARTQRLSAKLLELAQQPKKKDDVSMEGIDGMVWN